MDKINYIKMGKRIKKYREKLGMTQAFVAEEIDVSNSYISGIETGKSICSLATLHKLSILLKFVKILVIDLKTNNIPNNTFGILFYTYIIFNFFKFTISYSWYIF